MLTNQINKTAVKRTTLALLVAVASVTACNRDQEQVQPQANDSEQNARVSATNSCTTQLLSNGANFTPGSVPMLRPLSSGTANFNRDSDCDYFVGFQPNNYQRVVVATLDDAEVAQQIRRLISDPPQFLGNIVIGGGFGGQLARARRDPNDSNVYVVIGEGRANNYLNGLARNRARATGTNITVRSLLAKHLRLGNP